MIELPVAYAMGSAEYFAYGAVRLLDSLGVVDAMCFGSESGDIEDLQAIASILADEPEEYKDLLKTTCPTATRSLPQDKKLCPAI